MSFARRRSDRPGPARGRAVSRLEILETRQLLTGSNFSYYNPADYPISFPPGNVPTPIINHPIGIGDATLASLGNSGKVVTGQDRNGNTWTITVQGPGYAIVTDATPGDGVLADDINTIQLVGTNPNTTHVYGSVSASYLIQSPSPLDNPGPVLTNQPLPQAGEVYFSQLIAQNGVASIQLNGFVLTQTVAPPGGGAPYSGTGIFLPGGARNLSFTGIVGSFDQAQSAGPIDVTIGSPTNPLPYKPNIRIDSISNTVYNSSSTTVPTTPQTTPTIDLVVNGTIHNLEFGSVAQTTVPAAEQFLFPEYATTGRTSVQALGVDNLAVTGSAINLTVARTQQPFSSASSGLSHIGTAVFGGNADALALDSAGPIGFLEFAQGLGNPVGLDLTAADSGLPNNLYGYPAAGLMGGLVTASRIGRVEAAPADVIQLSSNNPALQQTLPGETRYYAKAGRALSNAAIVATHSIGQATIIGDSINSEIKTGYSVLAAQQGLQPTRGRSRIDHIRYRGDLVDSVVSASYQPSANGYGTPGSVVGPGGISGSFDGNLYYTGQNTVLNNRGVGFYSFFHSRRLPTNA